MKSRNQYQTKQWCLMVKRKEQNNTQTNASCPKMVWVQRYKHSAYNKIHAVSFSYL